MSKAEWGNRNQPHHTKNSSENPRQAGPPALGQHCSYFCYKELSSSQWSVSLKGEGDSFHSTFQPPSSAAKTQHSSAASIILVTLCHGVKASCMDQQDSCPVLQILPLLCRLDVSFSMQLNKQW